MSSAGVPSLRRHDDDPVWRPCHADLVAVDFDKVVEVGEVGLIVEIDNLLGLLLGRPGGELGEVPPRAAVEPRSARGTTSA
jgi:hypothetical protein